MNQDQNSERIVVVVDSQELRGRADAAVQLIARWRGLPVEYWQMATRADSPDSNDAKKTDKNGEKKSAAKQAESNGVRPVPESVSELLTLLGADLAVGLLVVVKPDGNDESARKLVERFQGRAVWLRPGGEPKRIRCLQLTDERDGWLGADADGNVFAEDNLADEFRSGGGSDETEADRLIALLKNHDLSDSNLILIPAGRSQQNSRWFGLGKRLMSDEGLAGAAIGLLRRPARLTDRWLTRIENFVDSYSTRMERDERVKLAEDLEGGSKLSVEFVLLICAATFLAAAGLVLDSAAVVIGAMLIAPLMTPILGSGMSLSYGNWPLFLRSLGTIAAGFAAGFVLSLVFGIVLTFTGQDRITNEMWARCFPSWMDFGIGLVGGSAAAYARTRVHLSSALAGAAIAAALVPPIATAGLQLAFSMGDSALLQPDQIPERALPVVGPMLVFLANALTIMIGSSFVLWVRGVRGYRDQGARARWGARLWMLLCFFAVLLAIWYVSFR